MRNVSAYDDLFKLYNSGITAVQEQVIRAIGTIGDMRDTERFVNRGTQKAEETRQANEAIMPRLRSLLTSNTNRRVTLEGIRALDALDSAATTQLLVKISESDHEPDIQAAATDARARYLARHKADDVASS